MEGPSRATESRSLVWSAGSEEGKGKRKENNKALRKRKTIPPWPPNYQKTPTHGIARNLKESYLHTHHGDWSVANS